MMPDFIERIRASLPRPWYAVGRVVLATLTISLLYAGIGQIWVWGSKQAWNVGWWTANPEDYGSEAEELAQRSAEQEAALAPGHARAVFRLGVDYGYLSIKVLYEPLDSADKTPSYMNDQPQLLALGDINLLQPTIAILIRDDLEKDLDGIASRVEHATSPRLRHLFLLGAQAGAELAGLQYFDDFIWPPPSPQIAKHGTLAGVPEPLWRPLTRLWSPWSLQGALQSDKTNALANYRAAINTLERYLETGVLPLAIRCRSVDERTGETGCWIHSNASLGKLPAAPIYWHIELYPSRAAAEVAKGPRSAVVVAFGKVWLLSIEGADWRSVGGEPIVAIGPLPVDPNTTYIARYMEATLAPGITASIHRHSGPEVWHILAGETCLETSEGKMVGRLGGAPVIIPGGIPMYVTAKGPGMQRALVLILYDSSKPASMPASDWTPKGLCTKS